MEGLVKGSDCDVGRVGCRACEERSDVGGKRLQWICGLGIVVGKQQVAYAVVEGVVQAALTLKGVALTERAVLEQQAYDLEVAAQTGLEGEGRASADDHAIRRRLTRIKGV